MNYDIVVIGGGPAGTSAALTFAKTGASVCLIEKCAFPRQKTCAGIITEKSIRVLKKILPEFKFKNYYSSNKINLFSQT